MKTDLQILEESLDYIGSTINTNDVLVCMQLARQDERSALKEALQLELLQAESMKHEYIHNGDEMSAYAEKQKELLLTSLIEKLKG